MQVRGSAPPESSVLVVGSRPSDQVRTFSKKHLTATVPRQAWRLEPFDDKRRALVNRTVEGGRL